MQRRPSSETSTYPVAQEIPSKLCSPEAPSCSHESTTEPTLCQINPIYTTICARWILILPSHLHVGLPSVFSHRALQLKCCMNLSSFLCVLHILSILSSRFDIHNNICSTRVQIIMGLLIMPFILPPVTSPAFGAKSIVTSLFSNTFNEYSSLRAKY
jgi:hypothetical protein